MIKEIILGDDAYLVDERVKLLTKDFNVVRTSSFTEAEISSLRQQSLFGNTAVLVSGKLDKASEDLLESFFEQEQNLQSALIYIPGYEDRRKKLFKSRFVNKIEKLKNVELLKFLKKVAEENNIRKDDDMLGFLIEYSEYEKEPLISLYDLIGVIKSSAGSALTTTYIIKSVIRSEKEDAFKLIQFIGNKEALMNYMGRLSTNPYQIIGALLYAFRIMAKLKLSNDIGITSYQMNQYHLVKDKWTLNELVDKMKVLSNLAEQHESKEVMKALVLYALVE